MTAFPPVLIDVVVPVYNGAATIESALRSMLDQTVRALRVIVVDDGSTDGTAAILARMAQEDGRLLVVTTENHGIVDALNAALPLCTAEFVARHDADDLAFPDRLERQMAYLAQHPDAVAVGCNVFHIDGNGRRTGHVTTFKALVVGDPYYAPSVEPYLMHPFLLVRRQALVDAGGYRYVFHSEDSDLYWRLARFGRLTNLTETLGEYRMHGESVSARSIVNGRIAAVNSQLAAVSERRRRDGRPDLEFTKAALKDYQASADLEAMLALAAKGLSREEKDYFEIATAAKLLELSSYRPYRLTDGDLATIRHIIERHYRSLSPLNRRQLVFRVILGRSRMSRNAMEALHLVPWRVMPRATFELGRHVLTRIGSRLARGRTA